MEGAEVSEKPARRLSTRQRRAMSAIAQGGQPLHQDVLTRSTPGSDARQKITSSESVKYLHNYLQEALKREQNDMQIMKFHSEFK